MFVSQVKIATIRSSAPAWDLVKALSTALSGREARDAGGGRREVHDKTGICQDSGSRTGGGGKGRGAEVQELETDRAILFYPSRARRRTPGGGGQSSVRVDRPGRLPPGWRPRQRRGPRGAHESAPARTRTGGKEENTEVRRRTRCRARRSERRACATARTRRGRRAPRGAAPGTAWGGATEAGTPQPRSRASAEVRQGYPRLRRSSQPGRCRATRGCAASAAPEPAAGWLRGVRRDAMTRRATATSRPAAPLGGDAGDRHPRQGQRIGGRGPGAGRLLVPAQGPTGGRRRTTRRAARGADPALQGRRQF